jgi:GNAT superfamily N-acetyltransferase
MTRQVVIRKAKGADARDVRAVRDAAILSGCSGHYQASLLTQWTAGPIDDGFIEDVETSFHVASIGDRIIATGKIDLKSGRIDAILVVPDCMRSGIGRAMLNYLEQLAIDAGLSRLTLDSTLNAAPFYRCCGYVGETISKYNSPRGISLDCIPMTKHLVPHAQMPNNADCRTP